MYNKILRHIVYLTTHPKRNEHKFLYFLVSIILLLLFVPLLEGGRYASLLLHILTTIILLTGIYAIYDTKRQLIVAIVFGLPWIIANWASLFIKMQTPGPAAISWGVLFFIYTTSIMFVRVIKSSKVTTETLYGAVGVYLLIGLTYTSLYGLLEIISPGSFNLAGSEGRVYPFRVNELIYYSYVTLTTLGYGDITPVSSYARSLTISEAIIGQLYLTILVARLIGLHIISFQNRNK